MKSHAPLTIPTLVTAAWLSVPATAWAAPPPAEPAPAPAPTAEPTTPPPATTTPPPATTTPPPVTTSTPPPATAPAPAPEPETTATIDAGVGIDAAAGEPVDPALAEPPPQNPPPEEPGAAWYERIDVGVFVDAYASVNFNFPDLQHGVNTGRAFDAANGFSFAWAGANIAYTGKKAAAILDLRFGPAPTAGWNDATSPIDGIEHIKQAIARYQPVDALTIDIGRWDTIFGAEVAESWVNHNYTRGFLYNLAQPFWHTGVRARGQVTDKLAITAMVVNGWSEIWDNNRGKGYGLQFGYTPTDSVALAIGYLGSPEHTRAVETDMGTVNVDGVDLDFRHLADIVFALNLDKFSLAFNFDYVFDDGPEGDQFDDIPGFDPLDAPGNGQYYGAMLSGRYQIVDMFAIAARAEFLGDPDGRLLGAEDNFFGSGTLTLDFTPSEEITLRLEGRFDGASEDVFYDDDGRSTTNTQGTITLGAVVHSF